MKFLFSYILLALLSLHAIAQEENANSDRWSEKPTFSFMGYLDVFYSYDFNKPSHSYRQPFFYQYNRHNEFNINQGVIQSTVSNSKYRATLGLQIGTYAEDNYVLESDVAKHIYEAYIGVALNKKNTLWLDAGLFSSHLGFESPISIDNINLTRTFMAECSPYFLTGAKVTYNKNRWLLMGQITNGWQRIQRLEGNSLPSFGTQVVYETESKATINWSTFIGSEYPDSTRRIRIFNDVFGIIPIGKKTTLIVGCDLGLQQASKGSSNYDSWLLPIIVAQYAFSPKSKLGLRAEYVEDKYNIVVLPENNSSYRTSAFSANFDYAPTPILRYRIEARWLNSKDKLYARENGFVRDDLFITGSIAIKILQ